MTDKKQIDLGKDGWAYVGVLRVGCGMVSPD